MHQELLVLPRTVLGGTWRSGQWREDLDPQSRNSSVHKLCTFVKTTVECEHASSRVQVTQPQGIRTRNRVFNRNRMISCFFFFFFVSAIMPALLSLEAELRPRVGLCLALNAWHIEEEETSP